MTEKKLIIIDGYGFVFRAYFSMPSLTSKDGKPIGAIYGFTSMLIKLLGEHDFSHIVVALDSGGKSFRHDLYPAYKANRETPPDDLIAQFPLIREVIEAFSIQSIELAGFEADDIIATLAKEAKNYDMQVKIISSDKDLMQLIDDNTLMFDPIKNKIISKEQVIEKFGVPPEQVLDALSLIGDASDNIPGAPGVGPKTAADLLKNYHSLDNILASLTEITKPKLKESLTNNIEKILLSKKLVSLDSNVKLSSSIDQFLYKNFDDKKLANFLDSYNFSSLKSRLKISHNKEELTHKKVEIVEISKLSEINIAIDKITNSGVVAIKFDQYLLRFFDGNIDYQIKMTEEQGLFTQGVNLIDLREIIAKILLNDSLHKIIYDFKDLLKFFNIETAVVNEAIWVDDLMLMAYACCHGNTIEALMVEYFPHEKEALYAYISLEKLMLQKLISEQMLSIYKNYDLPLVRVLYAMEATGILVSARGIRDLAAYFDQEIQKIEEQIFKHAGQQFNIGSPKQLAEVLYEKMGIDSGKKNNSTDAEILEKLASEGHIIAEEVLKWRHFSKLRGTYTDNLLKFADNHGRIHTCFLQTSTNTGRLSSVKPNLQNLPVRSSEGLKIRNNFIAPAGSKLVSADYSQIELRILAHMGQIESLSDAFRNGVDIHTRTASEIFEIAPEKVDSTHRRMAKTINFGIIYGISPYGLSSRLGIEIALAKKYIDLYFVKYPGIKNYMDKEIEFARKNGYVCTLAGRKCFMPGINDRNFSVRSFNERAAINAPLQGTQADIIKLAMKKLHQFILKDKPPVKMLLQIHDELLFEVADDYVADFTPLVKEIMEKAVKLDIPAPVDVSVGKNWGEL